MTSLTELLASLDRIAPFGKAGGWDPVGLQLGDPATAVGRVGVCHEVTDPVLDAAIEAQVDLLVSYHPLLFRPTNRLVAGRSAAGRAFRLVSAGVALGVVHTAYDVVEGGVADSLAAALGLEDVVPFGPNWGPASVKIVTFVPSDDVDGVAEAMGGAGGGTIGGYSGCSFRSSGTGTFVASVGTSPAVGHVGAASAEPEMRLEMIAPATRRDAVVAALVGAHPYEEPAYDVYEVQSNAGFIGRRGVLDHPMPLGSFAAHVETVLRSEARVAGDRSSLVRAVGVIPGSGADFIAAARGTDVVVTGDVGHHSARRALEQETAVVDPGHAPTERPGVARLYAAVAQLAAETVDLTTVDLNPWDG